MAEEIEKAEETEEKKAEKAKPATWRETRYNWYDNLNISLKQIDIIIGLACGGLVLTFIMIALDAMNII